MKKFHSIAGAILCASSVAVGALAAHALKNILLPEQLSSVETAVRYQFYHGLALILLANIYREQNRLSKFSLATMLCGVIFFSGSIYGLTAGMHWMFPLTPLGGALMISGWLLAIFSFAKNQPEKN